MQILSNSNKISEINFISNINLPDFTNAENRHINCIIIHHTEAKNANEAIELYLLHQVSTHYLIDESGKIYQLVADKNIAYHAGFSYWQGTKSLNSCSIGIELQTKNVNLAFQTKQIDSLILLLRHLTLKYQVNHKNILGHSDIAYNPDTLLLNRKQDPSPTFPWQDLAKHHFGIYSDLATDFFCKDIPANQPLCFYGQSNDLILEAKKNLAKIGYFVSNFNNLFDDEMLALNLVFCRHFNCHYFNHHNQEKIFFSWQASSQEILGDLVNKI